MVRASDGKEAVLAGDVVVPSLKDGQSPLLAWYDIPAAMTDPKGVILEVRRLKGANAPAPSSGLCRRPRGPQPIGVRLFRRASQVLGTRLKSELPAGTDSMRTSEPWTTFWTWSIRPSGTWAGFRASPPWNFPSRPGESGMIPRRGVPIQRTGPGRGLPGRHSDLR